jgi:uncharacterized protein YjbJ (UPF0337 family)
MKKRSSRSGSAGHGHEFKGVVKKTAGKLTGDRRMEDEGRQEMLKNSASRASSRPTARRKRRPRLNPDPHRRG